MNALNMKTRPADVTSRALLVQLSCGQWTARKLDRKVSADVAVQHGAKAGAGNYNKVLVARGNLAAIAAVVAQARQDHAFYSLPWLQDGTRIIPAAAFTDYSARMAKHRETFENEVREFCANYPDYIAQARGELGALFNATDYPSVRDIRARFNWSVTVLPMPDAADFRVDLDAATVAVLQADMAANVHSAMQSAVKDTFDRLHKVVRNMADKLAAYDPDAGKQGNPFRDTLVENVRELVAVLPSLNVMGDARLTKAIDDVQTKLTTHDAQALRDDATLRNDTAKAAADIADALSGWMQ